MTTNKKLTILVDYDDVLFPLLPTWIKQINLKYETNVKAEDITDWDITKFFPTLTKEQIFSPLYESKFWEEIRPLENNIKYLKKLYEDGHQIKIVTSTFYQNIVPKMKLLFRYYPYITWNQVIISSNKQCIKGDVLIDDAPHNLENGDYFKLLVNAPHNQYYDAKKNKMIRVQDIAEAYSIISSLAKNQ